MEEDMCALSCRVVNDMLRLLAQPKTGKTPSLFTDNLQTLILVRKDAKPEQVDAACCMNDDDVFSNADAKTEDGDEDETNLFGGDSELGYMSDAVKLEPTDDMVVDTIADSDKPPVCNAVDKDDGNEEYSNDEIQQTLEEKEEEEEEEVVEQGDHVDEEKTDNRSLKERIFGSDSESEESKVRTRKIPLILDEAEEVSDKDVEDPEPSSEGEGDDIENEDSVPSTKDDLIDDEDEEDEDYEGEDDNKEDEDEEEEEEVYERKVESTPKKQSKIDASRFVDDMAECDEDRDDMDNCPGEPPYLEDENDFVVQKDGSGKEVLVPFISNDSDVEMTSEGEEDDDDDDDEPVRHHKKKHKKHKEKEKKKGKKKEKHSKAYEQKIQKIAKLEPEGVDALNNAAKSKKQREEKESKSTSSNKKSKVVQARMEGNNKFNFAHGLALFAFITLTRNVLTEPERDEMVKKYKVLSIAQNAINTLALLGETTIDIATSMIPDGILKELVRMSCDAANMSVKTISSDGKRDPKLTTCHGHTIAPNDCHLISFEVAADSGNDDDSSTNTVIVTKDVSAIVMLAYKVKRIDHLLLGDNAEEWHDRCRKTKDFMKVVNEIAADMEKAEEVRKKWDSYQRLLLTTLENIAA